VQPFCIGGGGDGGPSNGRFTSFQMTMLFLVVGCLVASIRALDGRRTAGEGERLASERPFVFVIAPHLNDAHVAKFSGIP
jgi:hypothetical protein